MTNTEYTRERMDHDEAVTISLDEMLQPDEVSKVVLFLVSDEASPIKGAAVDVFGNRF
jgi:NAD(P)-dependent dehydrogenase (short-subunit alcohol dehydrogenase family)